MRNMRTPRRNTIHTSANGHGQSNGRVHDHGDGNGGGFDFTLHIRSVCEDMIARLEPLAHVDMGRVMVAFTQSRKPGDSGMHAALTPLRFAGGARHVLRRGRKWTVQQVREGGREMLYVLTFYLPRFLDLSLDEKLTTVVHELWHVSPRFDGDLRRFAGRCYAHGGSQAQYEAQVKQLVHCWLKRRPPESLWGFLRHDFKGLLARYGRVYGRKIAAPKLIPAKS
jgi:predicted metallopeptidase